MAPLRLATISATTLLRSRAMSDLSVRSLSAHGGFDCVGCGNCQEDVDEIDDDRDRVGWEKSDITLAGDDDKDDETVGTVDRQVL